MAHTPGPWEILDGMVTRKNSVKDEGNIICYAPPTARSLAKWPENAKLIAAAPDLLVALRNLLERDQTCHDYHAARAAIAKATA